MFLLRNLLLFKVAAHFRIYNLHFGQLVEAPGSIQ